MLGSYSSPFSLYYVKWPQLRRKQVTFWTLSYFQRKKLTVTWILLYGYNSRTKSHKMLAEKLLNFQSSCIVTFCYGANAYLMLYQLFFLLKHFFPHLEINLSPVFFFSFYILHRNASFLFFYCHTFFFSTLIYRSSMFFFGCSNFLKLPLYLSRSQINK